jgi:predicted GNAT family acetyltransferase
LIAHTNAHDDQVGETVELAKKFSPRVIAMVELRGWLTGQGVDEDMSSAMN